MNPVIFAKDVDYQKKKWELVNNTNLNSLTPFTGESIMEKTNEIQENERKIKEIFEWMKVVNKTLKILSETQRDIIERLKDTK